MSQCGENQNLTAAVKGWGAQPCGRARRAPCPRADLAGCALPPPQSGQRERKEGDPVPSAHDVSSSVGLPLAKVGQGLPPTHQEVRSAGREESKDKRPGAFHKGTSLPWKETSGAGSDHPPRCLGLPMAQRRGPEPPVRLDGFGKRPADPPGAGSSPREEAAPLLRPFSVSHPGPLKKAEVLPTFQEKGVSHGNYGF